MELCSAVVGWGVGLLFVGMTVSLGPADANGQARANLSRGSEPMQFAGKVVLVTGAQ
jgi:hypothetical protein